MPDPLISSRAACRPPVGADTRQPSVARIYDAALGGKDNFEADRRALGAVLEIAPGMRAAARRNRAWLRRVVRHLAGVVGIDQFLDLGAGLPAVANTHEIAQLVNPWARVVYMDNDPMCVAHGQGLLETNEDTVYLSGDLTDPVLATTDSEVWQYLDPRRPVALVLGAVLHHIPDSVDPAGVLARYVAALSPGSYVALTHFWDPGAGCAGHDLAREVQQRLVEHGPGSGWFRSREEIVSYFAGADLVEPGVVPVDEWWPSGPERVPDRPEQGLLLGGVAGVPGGPVQDDGGARRTVGP